MANRTRIKTETISADTTFRTNTTEGLKSQSLQQPTSFSITRVDSLGLEADANLCRQPKEAKITAQGQAERPDRSIQAAVFSSMSLKV